MTSPISSSLALYIAGESKPYISRQILIRNSKQTSWPENMTSRLPVWGGTGGNGFLEICEIKNHEVGVFMMLPTFRYLIYCKL